MRDGEIIVGTSRSHSVQAEIIHEKRHPNGAWISVVEWPRGRHFSVGHRGERRQSYINEIIPMPHRADDRGFETYFYRSKFDDMDKAIAYMDRLVATPHHPAVPKPYSKRPRDAQKQKVYDWEMRFYDEMGVKPMSKEECITLIRGIEAEFMKPANRGRLTIRFPPKGKSCYLQGYSKISLAPWGMQLGTIVHEMAHWVTKNLIKGRRMPGHGPEFVGIYMLMMEHYCGQSMKDMMDHARTHRMKYVFPEGGLDALRYEPASERLAA
jgi:hypothetical protein